MVPSALALAMPEDREFHWKAPKFLLPFRADERRTAVTFDVKWVTCGNKT